MNRKEIFSIIGLCLLAVMLFVAGRNAVASVPSDFQTTQIVGTGLDGPTGFSIAPDGRIFILERTGNVKIFKNDQLLTTPFTVLPSEGSGDRGLIGVAFDPNYASNYYVYFYYTGTDLRNHLVRFDASSDVGQNGPIELYKTTQPSQLLHVGGTIAFGGDGKLYLSIGDNGYSANSQDLSNPFGKVLRLNKDGTIPTDNPFYGQSGKLPEIWAYGFRNPFRFTFDSATQRLFLGDVGSDTTEEVNLVIKGGNYGWPNEEGPCPSTCPYLNPIYSYPHNGGSRAVVAGAVYRGSMFPAEYTGNLFIGDYAAGFIKRLILDGNGNVTSVVDFDPLAGSVVDMEVANDGSLYYITYYPGRLYRVSYSTVSSVPTANASADVTTGLAPLTVNFSSTGSSDPDNDPLTYLWKFGDGTTSNQANPTKVYQNDGAYTVDLAVSDGTNISHAIPIIIQVGIPPTLTIATPVNNSKYNAGDTIFYAASGQDGAGRDLPDSAFITEVRFHHQTHFHPFLGPLYNTQNGSFVIPITGESSAETWYEIIVTATDVNGLSTVKSVSVYPNVVNLNFATSPTNLTYYIDGVPHSSSYATQGVVGFQRELKTIFSQVQNSMPYEFDHWSDNGGLIHTITTPNVNNSYTAYFVPAPAYHTEFFSNKTLSGTPTLTKDYATVNFLWNEFSPDPSIPADNFSARITKTDNFSSGTYRFTVTSDDGVRVYIDNALVIDKWIDQGSTTYTADRALSGTHTIKIEYYESSGGAILQFDYDQTTATPPPPPPPPTTGFAASYWNAGTGTAPAIPTTTPTLSRTDVSIDFDWGGGSPDPIINIDHFVAVWTKAQDFTDGTYRFTVRGDDGMRLYIDNQLVIDKWIDQGATTYTADRALTAGSHNLRIEYYENAGGALMEFSFAQISVTPPPPPPPTPLPPPPPPPTTGFAASYWNAGTGSAPAIPTTTPTLSRTDAVIDFDWGGGSPDPIINIDHFVAVWTKAETFTAGNYEFSVAGDDGVRLYVDNNLVIDKWIDQGLTTYKTTLALTDGTHNIKLEYYENAGGAAVDLSWQQVTVTPPPVVPPPPPPPVVPPPPPPVPTVPFNASFWNTPTATVSPAIPTTAPNLTRTDNAVNFLWGSGSPDPVINANHFIGVWTRTQTYTAGTYTFSLKSDEGARLYVDNQLVINNWKDHSFKNFKVNLSLTAASHTVRIEYYENVGDASIVYTEIKN